MIERIAAALRSMVTRGKVTQSVIGPRTLLQVTGLDNEVKTGVEYALPFGMIGRPRAGADVLLLQVLGSRDHLVAIGGDATGQVVADLAAGELGFCHDEGGTLIFRNGGTVVVQDPSGTKWTMTNNGTIIVDGTLRVTGDIIDNCNTQPNNAASMRSIFDTHTHAGIATGVGHTAVPDQTM